MALFPIRQHVTVVDINGDIARSSYPSTMDDATTTGANLDTASQNFAAALIACSNGKVIQRSTEILWDKSQLIVGTTPPTNAEYSSVTDGARLQLANNLGERTSVTIPAVKEASFGASSNVVDSTQAQIAALLTLLKVQAMDAAGVAYNLYKGGIKTGRRARIRRTSLVP